MQSSLATQAEKGVGAVSRAHQVLLKAPACFIFTASLWEPQLPPSACGVATTVVCPRQIKGGVEGHTEARLGQLDRWGLCKPGRGQWPDEAQW